MFQLIDFIRESNRIEGIIREPLDIEIEAHEQLLGLDSISVADLEEFVHTIQPNARLRMQAGENVQVGEYFPPPGDITIKTRLMDLLALMDEARIKCDSKAIYALHHAYERLHHFMDGNGRSGRALWLWCHEGYAPLGFLHQWYYDTLKYGAVK